MKPTRSHRPASEQLASQPSPEATTQGRRQRGQALVEFTIVIPAFFLLVAGMFDFGFGLYTDLTIINAAREGARMGVLDPGNATAIQARVSEAADNLDAARMSVTVSCRRPAGSSFVGCTAPLWQPGDATVVKVDYRYSMIFPLLFGTELPLSSEVAMRIE